MEADHLELLIGTVDPVILQSEADKQTVEAQDVTDQACRRNGAAHPDQERVPVILVPKTGLRGRR